MAAWTWKEKYNLLAWGQKATFFFRIKELPLIFGFNLNSITSISPQFSLNNGKALEDWQDGALRNTVKPKTQTRKIHHQMQQGHWWYRLFDIYKWLVQNDCYQVTWIILEHTLKELIQTLRAIVLWRLCAHKCDKNPTGLMNNFTLCAYRPKKIFVGQTGLTNCILSNKH